MHFPQTFGSKLHKSGTFPMRKYGGKRGKKARNVGQSYTLHFILHPNLHPKMPEFIRIFHTGCRKCRRFSKNFFLGGERKNVETSYTRRRTGIPKHRTSLHKTSVLLRQNLRTFAQRSPMFCIFRTVLFCIIRTAIFPPQKKFWFCVNLGDRHVLAWLINLSDNQHIN